MHIGELAAQAGVNTQTLRYYERRGLLGAARGRTSRYREFESTALRRVRFIKRAQDLGFTLEEIRDLLALWTDSAKSCSAVERRARTTLQRIDAKIADLQQMSGALGKYVSACQKGAALTHCPLLEELGGTDRDADV